MQDDRHNLFRSQVTICIDEFIFKPLFYQQTDPQNASVRVLMVMVLKEAIG